MAKDHRGLDAELAQEVLPDDSGFLHQIVERVVRQMLEAEMTERIGAAPHERRALPAPRPAQRLQAQGFENQGRHSKNLLVPQDREGTFSLLASSPATRETRRRSFWPRWRCTWSGSPPGR